jgi:hypothetical protein
MPAPNDRRARVATLDASAHDPAVSARAEQRTRLINPPSAVGALLGGDTLGLVGGRAQYSGELGRRHAR